MSDYCIICECEPVETKPEGMNFSWFREIEGYECICPWCVDDMHKNKLKVDEINAKWEIWNMRIETIKKLQAEIKELKK